MKNTNKINGIKITNTAQKFKMAGLRELHKKLQAINLDVLKDETIKENEGIAVDMNKDQLEAGFDSNNKRLRGYSSPFYAAEKNRMNPRPGFGNPDLLYRGNFYKGFGSQLQGDSLKIDSSDKKRDWLVKGTNRMEGFGEDIFGLTTNNKEQWDNKNITTYLTKFSILSGIKP